MRNNRLDKATDIIGDIVDDLKREIEKLESENDNLQDTVTKYEERIYELEDELKNIKINQS